MAIFLNFTLFYIKTPELLSGEEGRGEDLAGKTRMNRTVNRKKKKGKKSERNVGDLWAEKRITVIKVGYPGNGLCVTWTVDVQGVALF